MREITKREQVITDMKKSPIYLLCLRETKIPSSSIEQRDKYIFVFSTSETVEQTTTQWVSAIIRT